MDAVNFHPEVPLWIDAMTANLYIVFDADEARDMANRLNLKFFHLVFKQLKDNGVVKNYKGRFTFDMQKLYFYFGQPERWS